MLIEEKKKVIKQAVGLINKDYKHVLEFGVASGDSLRFIASLTNYDGVDIYGFDTFTGLPIDWKNTVCKAGFFSNDGNVPDIPNVTFYKGLFSDTLPEYIKVADKISFLHIDSDLYESAVEIFNALNNYIVSGTIILFDEWIYFGGPNNPKYFDDCEQKAFFEWASKFNRNYELVAHNKNESPEQQIVKIL